MFGKWPGEFRALSEEEKDELEAYYRTKGMMDAIMEDHLESKRKQAEAKAKRKGRK